MVQDVSKLIDTMLESVESGELHRFSDCFEPDAVVWHNTDEKEMALSDVLAFIGAVTASSTERRYENKRIVVTGNAAFVQQVLRVTFRNGTEMRCPVMLGIEVSPGGRISRLNEYFDSRSTDCLAEALGMAEAPLR